MRYMGHGNVDEWTATKALAVIIAFTVIVAFFAEKGQRKKLTRQSEVSIWKSTDHQADETTQKEWYLQGFKDGQEETKEQYGIENDDDMNPFAAHRRKERMERMNNLLH